MRLPLKSDDSQGIDLNTVSRMVDEYMAAGCNYFDTSYVYHDGKSENAIKEYVLDKILSEHPEVDAVQIVINYIDWEARLIQAKKCYETIRRHNRQVIIMEPVNLRQSTTISPSKKPSTGFL